MSCVAKVYSKILTARLSAYAENNDLLSDEQNGFHSTRSCIDHIFVLSTILINRLSQGKETFLSIYRLFEGLRFCKPGVVVVYSVSQPWDKWPILSFYPSYVFRPTS